MLKNKVNGVTLIELMTTIAVLAVVSAIAIPSLGDFISRNRLTGVANDLNSTLMTARSEAVKLKTPITVSPNGGSWANGWTVTYIDGGNKIELQNQGKIQKGLTLGSSSSTDSVVFDATGYSKNDHLGANGVVFCGNGKDGRKIDVSPSGTSKVEKVEC